MANLQCKSNVLRHFAQRVPKRPYATDNPGEGMWRQAKSYALKAKYVQPQDEMLWCMCFDCDHGGAYWAAEDGVLPLPNLKILNPDNGRGHLIYYLASPVPRTDAARRLPLNFLAKIERGLCCRLDADPQYVGLIVKNPLNRYWRTTAVHDHSYTLGELDEVLHEANCTARPRKETFGLGRNCVVFDELRHMAYAKVLEFKRNGEPQSNFLAWANRQANALNGQFPVPMHFSETRGIGRSVSKWVWERFDVESFQLRQSARGKRGNAKRWANHVSQESLKPWEAVGISRATYFRRKKGNATDKH